MNGLRLFCFACAGASATTFPRWQRYLPAPFAVVPMERPGRGRRIREPHERDFERLVAAHCREIMAHGQGSYVLFGHSLGGLVAFACAHRLKALGHRPPEALVIAAAMPPARRDIARIAALTSDAALIGELRRQGGTPAEVFADADLLRFTLDTLAADFALYLDFQAPAEPLDIPILAFGGRTDEISAMDLSAWAGETTAAASSELMEGGHFFLRQTEAAFLQRLEARLSAATSLFPEKIT